MEADEFFGILSQREEAEKAKIDRHRERKRRNQETRRINDEKKWQKGMIALIKKAGGKCQECGYCHKIESLEFYDENLQELKETLKKAIRANKNKDTGPLIKIHNNIWNYKLLCRGCVYAMEHPWI